MLLKSPLVIEAETHFPGESSSSLIELARRNRNFSSSPYLLCTLFYDAMGLLADVLLPVE